MPRQYLNDKFVEGLRTDRRTDYWDTLERGFGVRVTPEGTKTFFVLYRVDGRRVRFTLGRYAPPKKGGRPRGGLSLADARDMAAAAKQAVAKGRDPQAEKVAERTAESFGELADEYLERHAKKRKRSWREDKRMLDKDILPAWKHRKAKGITRRDVKLLLNGIVDRGAPVAANRTLALVSRVFNYGIDEEILEANPAARVKRPGAEASRDRVLRDEEIRSLWQALDLEDPLTAATYRLRLLTAQRGVEVFAMRWDEIEGDWWTIPASISKNKLSHRVPLSPTVLEILKTLEPLSGREEWVFPAIRSAGGHFTRHSIKDATARLRERAELEDFRPHDLRRTAATKMSSMGIDRLTISKVLNHVETGVTATYDRASYDAEKRQALTRWADRLQEILDEKKQSNVVKIG